MNEITKFLNGIDFDDFGDLIWEHINDWDNSSTDMGKYTVLVFDECETEGEFKIANAMLTAITGYSIQTLLGELAERYK